MEPLTGFTLPELEERIKALDLPAYRARQLWNWVYVQGHRDFSRMSNMTPKLRNLFSREYSLARPKVAQTLHSSDGTRKWLLAFEDEQHVECVHIPETDRGTLCLSSQVGCTLTCRFCHTGTQRLVRHLNAEEIVGQYLFAKDELGEWPRPLDAARQITNLVFMGMGEPLFNYENLSKALTILMDPGGLAFSKRRITVSTAGVVPQMKRLGQDHGVNLAVSLHAVTDELRTRLMPVNKAWPLEELIAACRDYPGASNARRITFEYVLLADVNDSKADARALLKLLSGLPAKVNLIPFNAWPGANFERPRPFRVAAFQDILMRAGISAPVRQTRGEDIYAACGQLKTQSTIGRASRSSSQSERIQTAPA